MRRLTDGMIQSSMETLLITATKEATSWFLSPVYGAVGDIAKQAVNRGVADNAISLRLDRLTRSQDIGQRTVGCLLKTPIFTAPITKLVNRNAEIVFTKEAEFYVPGTNVGKENKEAKTPSPLTGRYPASLASSKRDEKDEIQK